jgi:hypothetical protein
MRYMNLSPITLFNTEWVNALNVPIQNCKWMCKDCRNLYTAECAECKHYTELHSRKNAQESTNIATSNPSKNLDAFVVRMQKVMYIVEMLKVSEKEVQDE